MGRNAPTEEKRKQDDATLQIIFDYVQWRVQGGGFTGVITPPLVAEICLCSNSNFSPTGAIPPPPLSGPPWPSPPPLQKILYPRLMWSTMFTLNMHARIRKQTYENRASHTSPKVDNSTTDTKEDNTMKIVSYFLM